MASDSDFQTTSPQGDGNTPGKQSLLPPWSFQTTSPQGDGNESTLRGGGRFNSFKPLPRKGTETRDSDLWAVAWMSFQTTSPQGDGNGTHHWPSLSRGVYFQTTSPQGDGNWSRSSCFALISRTLSNHFPARGRKLIDKMAAAIDQRLSNHFPARGRKQR